MKQMNLSRQLRRLYLLEFLGSFRLAGSIWVLLLAARGFSLFQIGVAESLFHAVSLCCEIPSGMLADLLGRKRTLAAGQLASALSALLMLLSADMAGVCAAMALSALGFNLASGTREAITYDSLLRAGRAGEYLHVSALQNLFWRVSAGAAMLCAGAAVLLGHRRAYALDCVLGLLGFVTALGLTEPQAARPAPLLRDLPAAMLDCAGAAARFLRAQPRSAALMLFNALAGACATLLNFFLQDGLSAAGASPAALGPLLFLLSMGGAAGSRLAPALGRLPYRTAALLSLGGVAAGLLLAASGRLPLMVAGGFLAAVSDDALELRTDAELNGRLPSAQRATLISVSSMCFSLVMIALSPLAGLLAGG